MLRIAFRSRRAWLIGGLLLAALSAALLTRIRVDANVLNLFPQEGSAIRAFQRYLRAFGSLDRVYVAIDAPPDRGIEEFDADIDAYLATLRQLPDVRRVDDGRTRADGDWSYLLDRQLLLFDPDRLDAALARFRPPELDQQLEEARARLTTPSPAVRTLVQEDPLGLLNELRHAIGEGPLAAMVQVGDGGYVSPDGRARLILVEPVEPPFDSAFARSLTAQLDAAAQSLPEVLTIAHAGGYHVAVESEDLIKSESVVNGTLSLAAILVLMTVVFRSARAALPILLPIVVASMATIAIDGTIQPLSAAAAGSAAILFGIGVDHTLLLYVRTLEHRRQGGAEGGLPAVLATAAGGIAIAVATTAATFFGLLVVDLPALQDLGRVGGVGILMCGIVGLLLFPALLPRPKASARRPLEIRWLPRFIDGHRRGILAAAVIASMVAAWGAAQLQLRATVDALAPPSRSARLAGEMASRFNLPQDTVFAVAEGDALEPLLESHARLADEARQAPAGLAVIGPAHLLPPAAAQARAAARIAAAGLTATGVERDLALASARAGFRPDAFAPFLTRLPTLLDAAPRLTLDGLHAHGLAPVIEPFVARDGDRFVTVSYLYPKTPDALADAAAVVREAGGGLVLTGVGEVNAELEAKFAPEFAKGVAIGLIAVVLLVVIGFGSVGAGLRALVPVALGLLWTAGLLGLARVPLDLFSVFGVLMCIGIGVDYGVHLWHRQHQEGDDGRRVALTRTAPAVLLSGATTMIGFGSLTASSYPPLHALGLVTTISIAACLIAALFVVPAMTFPRSTATR